ncbi:hypothetical protein CI238_08857 [Colletotrichum incanum]|uniref:Uncharacterized protein n=1 Tax=Colletotrichum incanum TaxID=1573173 RepID=A0A167ASY2_COLIC|nr:hypothetical protein CI238_08857 [Colletotrichum incanum]OHW98358.1 hypothetical protein CSPAE12_03140 [Colletotrichum incanum]
MTITEVGCCGVKPDLSIMDETTPEGQTYLGVYKMLIVSPGGPHRMYLSVDLDEPSMVYGFFDWDSLEHHENFAKTFGKDVQSDLAKVLTHGEYTKHITATPSLPEALKSPVTDVFLVYFPSAISVAEKATAATDLQKILNKGFGQHPKVTAIGYGWGVQNDFPVYGKDGGKVGSAFSAFVGWSSVEANTEFRGAGAHNTTRELIQSLDGVVKLKVLRLNCTVLEKMAE